MEFVDADTLRRLLPTEEFDIPLGVSTAALYRR
ncbi:hypothetical protein SAMN04489765_2782 [Tsukamurella pulmonis]|uniref:Uncharacterized protein n=1 Tax=Tsukamurella pulmonis TaxID=47312 RepID=A0A1H1FLD7_9ACTN|nr:hypothetical protein SAMN04489765_2782 [Tsukamurella pulmonis]SUP19224.1 Uncharacterised protein [Tsukamurella pulmonis]